MRATHLGRASTCCPLFSASQFRDGLHVPSKVAPGTCSTLRLVAGGRSIGRSTSRTITHSLTHTASGVSLTPGFHSPFSGCVTVELAVKGWGAMVSSLHTHGVADAVVGSGWCLMASNQPTTETAEQNQGKQNTRNELETSPTTCSNPSSNQGCRGMREGRGLFWHTI